MHDLAEVVAAVDGLPTQAKQELFELLASQLHDQVATGKTQFPGHSVLDIEPLKLGAILQPLGPDDDLLGEMLESRQ